MAAHPKDAASRLRRVLGLQLKRSISGTTGGASDAVSAYVKQLQEAASSATSSSQGTAADVANQVGCSVQCLLQLRGWVHPAHAQSTPVGLAALCRVGLQPRCTHAQPANAHPAAQRT